MADRAHDFRVQARHCAKNRLRYRFDIRSGRLRQCAGQIDEFALFFAPFGPAEWLVQLFRQRGSDRAAADWHIAGENLVLLDEYQVGRTGADIDQERATAELIIIIPKRVRQSHRRDINNDWSQPGGFDCAIQDFEQIGFDRDEHHLQLFIRATANQLVIPNYFTDWKWDILLRFKRNDAFDFFLFDGGQFDEAGEDRLTRDGVIHSHT